MDWWIAGLVLSALVGVAARDVGRPGRASAPALLVLRSVGGLGLVAMAALSVRVGSPGGALVAILAAVPLLAGLTGGVLRARPEARARPIPRLHAPAPRAEGDTTAQHDGRRAA